jgi:hypothetical protein
MLTTGRRIDIRTGHGYDGRSYRSADRRIDATACRCLRRAVISISRPDMDTTSRRTDRRTVVSLRRLADAYDEPSYRYPDRIWIRRAVVPIGGPSYRCDGLQMLTTSHRIDIQTAYGYDEPSYRSTDRRIHIQAVVRIRRAVVSLGWTVVSISRAPKPTPAR